MGFNCLRTKSHQYETFDLSFKYQGRNQSILGTGFV